MEFDNHKLDTNENRGKAKESRKRKYRIKDIIKAQVRCLVFFLLIKKTKMKTQKRGKKTKGIIMIRNREAMVYS